MGHPFSSLFVSYDLAVSRFDPVDRAAAALRLRDAYLDSWTDKASLSTLRDTFTLAVWAGYVSRALGFAQMLDGATSALIEEWQRQIDSMTVRSSCPQSVRNRQVRPLSTERAHRTGCPRSPVHG